MKWSVPSAGRRLRFLSNRKMTGLFIAGIVIGRGGLAGSKTTFLEIS